MSPSREISSSTAGPEPSSNVSVTLPISMRSPLTSFCFLTAVPFTFVPLVDPRSATS